MPAKKNWIKLRHKVISKLAALVLRPYCRLTYGVKIRKFKEQNGRQYLILFNHQTVFDQFFVGLAFKGAVYYLATEDIFSNGWVSSLIKYAVAPIPIKKQTTDVKAVMNCIRIAKEGGTIALAPEGNRTYSGKTEYMNPAIASLVKKLKLPLVLFRIEGGYGVQPRWTDELRKGKMSAYVSRVVEPEEYGQMTNEELYELIKTELYVDEAKADGEFRSKKLAEYLERAVYVCPFCGLSVFESHGDTIECTRCGRKIKYLPSKELQGVDHLFPFRFVSEWYEYQKEYINRFDPQKHIDVPLYKDIADVSKVIVYKKKVPWGTDVNISLFGDRVVFNEGAASEFELRFDDVSVMAVLGRNKLNIYFGDEVLQLKGSKRFNALKYVHIFYRYRNIKKGEANVEFLGL